MRNAFERQQAPRRRIVDIRHAREIQDDDDRKNVVKNSGTTVKNKTKKIVKSSVSYTINLFFAVFWGCHCIWASASVRGHPREKHLVYVVGAGSRAAHCKKRGSKRAASRRENGQKSFKMPRDRLFWRRFEVLEQGPPGGGTGGL